MLRLKRQAVPEAEHEAEERRERGESPPTIQRQEVNIIEERMRAENPSLTLAGTRLPFQFPLDPTERMLYGPTSKAGSSTGIRSMVNVNSRLGCGRAAGTPQGHQHQLWALFEAMDGLMTQCWQQMYVDDVFEKRLTNMLGRPCRSVRMDTATKHAHLAGWELTLFG
eukprot:924574-Pleurochrysis_carterae.AAC.1